jgi:hypothetical protein
MFTFEQSQLSSRGKGRAGGSARDVRSLRRRERCRARRSKADDIITREMISEQRACGPQADAGEEDDLTMFVFCSRKVKVQPLGEEQMYLVSLPKFLRDSR